MNIAIFTDNDFAEINGVTTTLRAVLQHAPHWARPRIYTLADADLDLPECLSLRVSGVPIPFASETRMYLPPVARLLQEAVRDAVDVIHMTTPGPMGLAAMRIARLRGIPMVGSFHADLGALTGFLSGSERLGALVRAFRRWPYDRCAHVLAPSEATRRLLMRSTADSDRVAVWQRGVDSDHFHPGRRSEDLRHRWGVSNERPAILYVGRVSREKGLDLLPDIQGVLQHLGLRHRFVIAGQGPMQGELQRRLSDAVFTGVLDRDAIADTFASSDVFLFPSRADPAGNVVLEAQACGLPVLVTNVGGPQENLVDGETGHVIRDMAPNSWASALTPLLRQAERRAQMGAAARAYAEPLTWASALEPLFSAYRDLAVGVAGEATRPDLIAAPRR